MHIIECVWVWYLYLLLIYKMKVKTVNITIVIKKNMITEFFNDKLNNFIFITYKLLKKNQIILVRLLGFEPRTSWSVAKRSIQLSYRRNYDLI